MIERVQAPSHKDALTAKLRTRSATIGVIGLGYVGLPLALNGLRQGFSVIGFDVDAAKVRALRSGDYYLPHIDHGPLHEAIEQETFTATADYQLIAQCDAVIMCVPAPLGEHHEPDLSFVRLRWPLPCLT
jgi:UDP-N-acetyl-D-glucosamine dehydrogenase